MSGVEETIPPQRRATDQRIEDIERKLDDNTILTQANTDAIFGLRKELGEVNTKTDSLLDMKTTVENHIGVLCTWARWIRRGVLWLFGALGVILPVIVAAKQLGWL